MKESHIEGPATRDDPKPSAGVRKDAGEASVEARSGTVLSREIRKSGAPTPLTEAEGNTSHVRQSEHLVGSTRSETRRTSGTFSRENREVPTSPAADGAAGRTGKANGQMPVMNDAGKSDRLVVPAKSSNKAGSSAAETMEGRSLAKRNVGEQNALRTQSRESAHSALDRVRQAAAGNSGMKFTALLHHVDIERLRSAFRSLKKDAAPGVDDVTWHQYAEKLEDNLQLLHARLHRGAYRAKASKRVYIPKADGRLRPLGIAALEDKVVQRAVVEVMNAIYEKDFLGFSYGFRPGRSQHNALDALAVGLLRKKVGWVLDADIRGFFDTIDHEWLVKFVEHRIQDRRVLRLIQKWLGAGVMEEGKWAASEVGTPQGATISPLLANIYLHYVLDLWAAQWRKKRATGEMIIVRYADDFIVGFQRREDAELFLAELRERLAKFRLELHPEKTRLIAFGRFALLDRQRRGLKGSPETFNFLGFTHICAVSKRGRFVLGRHTMRQRLTAKLKLLKAEMLRRRHQPIPQQGKWLASVVRGHMAYYAVPTNILPVGSFRNQVAKSWHRALLRRSQRSRLDWSRMGRLINRWLPTVRIIHPWPDERFDVRTQGKSRVR